MLSPNNLIKKYNNIGKYRFVRISHTSNMKSALPTTLNEHSGCLFCDAEDIDWIKKVVREYVHKKQGVNAA